MVKYEKPRDGASEALIELRKKLGMTQAVFAVQVLDTAVTTIARYETSHRPPGEVLLRLSGIARERGELELADQFRIFYLEDVLRAVGNQVTMIPESESGPAHGYLTTALTGKRACTSAIAFLKVLGKLKDPRPDLSSTELEQVAQEKKRALAALDALDEVAFPTSKPATNTSTGKSKPGPKK